MTSVDDFFKKLNFPSGSIKRKQQRGTKQAVKQFLDLNVDILKIMLFQDMNARAMTKILKKFDKLTHLEGQHFVKDLRFKYPALSQRAAPTP
ncbi:hypothetical protein LTR08_008827 [Meristemomyces frigidus]|nr:hypothetical protein LTR08_008827 [Meristemomyces frigidus]